MIASIVTPDLTDDVVFLTEGVVCLYPGFMGKVWKIGDVKAKDKYN